MMLPFTNFTKGELAPELQARIDTQQYGAAARKVRNFIIQRYGGLAFRPGFRFVAEEDPTKNIRYVPFQFNMEQSYIMALGDSNMRLLTGGGLVLEEDLKITAVTKAANAQITAAYHGLSVGEQVYLHGNTGMTELNGRTATVVSVIDANNFTVDIDTTNFTTFVSSTGTARTGAPPPPPPPPAPPAPPPPVEPPPPTTDNGGSGSNVGGADEVFSQNYSRDGYIGGQEQEV